MKRKQISIIIATLVSIATSVIAAQYQLDPVISLGQISAATTDNAIYNLNDDSWIVNVTPVITNKLQSNNSSNVVLRNSNITVKQITVYVKKSEVYTTLGVTNFENTLLIDFQNALIQTAMYKLYQAVASTNQP